MFAKALTGDEDRDIYFFCLCVRNEQNEIYVSTCTKIIVFAFLCSCILGDVSKITRVDHGLSDIITDIYTNSNWTFCADKLIYVFD